MPVSRSKTSSLIPSKRVSLADVSDQFCKLARDLAPYDRSYEALCQVAAARTDRLIPHSLQSELQHMVQAARSFRESLSPFNLLPR